MGENLPVTRLLIYLFFLATVKIVSLTFSTSSDLHAMWIILETTTFRSSEMMGGWGFDWNRMESG